MSAATTTTVESIWQSPVAAALEATSSPTVSGSEPVANSTNVRRDTPIAAYVNLPNVGHGVDKLTLKGNVRLYKASDASKTPIPGEPNTTGGGDAIIFTPSALLDANTKYTFEVTSGVKDTAGAAFKPYAMSFTTGTAGAPTASNIAFNKVALSNATGKRFTGVTIGPDGKLYAGTMSGEIVRWNINADGTLSSTTTINTIKSGNGGQSRIVTGIRFDPSSTSTNLILWVTHGHGAEEGAPNWTGKLTRLTGSSLGTYQDYVTGLPRSVRDHLTNQIDFDAERRLYISQGSQNAMGAPDNAWGQRPEVLLSAAILRVDYNAIAARIASGQGPLNVKTSDGGTYSPYAPGAAVTLYATGVRNAYDLLWHSNGNLYAPTNGSAPGGNTPAGGGAPGLKNVQQNEPDWLFKIRKDKYYGHPNPTRQEYVLNGGNPTSGTDKYQVNAYPVGTKPDADWDPAIYSFGANRSPNGVIEYKSGTFGGALKGNLLVVRYSGGDDVIALAPDAGGNISSTGVKTGLSGLTGFVDPLDLVEHVGPGNLYVIEHGAQKITLLRPKGSTGGGGGGTPGTDAPVRNPNVVYFNDPVGGTASPARTLKIRNSGGSAFNINEISLAGTDASMFRIVSKPALPKSLAGGTTQDITVEFNPPAGSALGLRKAQVVVKTSSSTTPQLTYDLRALATAGLTGANEPSLQRILDLFQLPINAGDANPSTSDMPLPLASGNDNVSLERLVKAGSGNVTIEPLAVFASSGQPTIKFGWYPGGNSGSLNQVATFTDSQSVNPGLTSGSFNFDPGSGSFGLYTVAPAFGTRVTYSEASKNTWEPVSANRDKMLLFPLKDKNGNVVPNAYVMGWEEVSGSYDYQDFLAVIRNVRDPNSVPPPPPPNEGVGTITGLTLVNADNDQPIGPFENNTTINYGAFNTKAVTVRADTIGNIGSVRWGLDANANFRTENFAPYAIGGDQNTTDLLPFNVPMGTHTLTATAYSGPDGTGEVLKTITYTFHVADVPVVAPSGGRIVGLTLVNADNDQPIGPFENNTTIHYAAMGVKNVTVRAETDGGTIGSVRWGLDGNGNFRTENFAPFAIGGDVNTTDLLPFSVAPGSHQLTVIAYGGRDATGPILSQLTLTFHVADTPA